MAKILILGGSGFIGTHLAGRLLEAGDDVSLFDVVPPSKSSATFVKGDVFDPVSLGQAVAGSDTIIDLIGLADVGVCQREPDRSFRLNVASLANVLESARKAQVRKIVFPSSAAVYGKVETVPIDETQPPNPSTVYAWHKWMAELLLKSYRQSYHVGYVILRLFNVLGEGNKGVAHHYVQMARTEKRIHGFGRDQLRDFVDAADVANAFRLAAVQRDVSDKIINIGSGEGIKIGEVAGMVGALLPGTKVEFEEKADYIPYHSVADITLARKLLDFNPRPGREVMKELVQELVKHGG
jgi:UDP-glucose 4-epimerase